MEKRERVNKQTSVTQSKSNSRTGGKEPICTNAQSLHWRKSLVSTGECWSVSAETLFSLTAIQQDLQYHDDRFPILFVTNTALLSPDALAENGWKCISDRHTPMYAAVTLTYRVLLSNLKRHRMDSVQI